MCIYPHIPTNNGPGERKKTKKNAWSPLPVNKIRVPVAAERDVQLGVVQVLAGCYAYTSVEQSHCAMWTATTTGGDYITRD